MCEQATLSESVRDLFRLKFGHPPPEEPIHVVAYWNSADAAHRPVCYIHFYEWEGCLLGGGACVDQRALKQMSSIERARLRAAGGPYFLSLRMAVEHFRKRYRAVFGYCGDPLAERIDLRAGFEKTPFASVVACWSPDFPAAEKHPLLEKVHALGPF